jgi:DNA primase
MDFAQQLKQSVDIVQVVGEYVRLQKAGPNSYRGLCPFHQEKTPSFHVRPAQQHFKCFGCQKGGGVIDFVMEIEGLSFWEACVQLAERYGIPLPKRAEPSDESSRKRAASYEANEIALKVFRGALLSAAGEQARAYLKRRGVTRELAEEFGLGYAAPGGQTLAAALQKAGLAAQQIEESGLVLRRQDGSGFYDRFRNRLIFPIHNESGKLIAFAGRALGEGDEPKYLNSPETAVYHKSGVLYNLHRAKKDVREKGYSILVEGYMDVIGLHGAGVANAVATCGTALTSTQARMLKRHAENIVVNFDPDPAGAAAAERSIQILLDESMRIRVLELEGGLDPDEFVAKHGAEGYAEAVRRAPRYFHWLADRVRARFDMRSAEGRMEGLRHLMPAIQRVPERIERAAIAADVASYLGVETSVVLDQFKKAAVSRGNAAIAAPPPALPAGEALLIRCLVRSAEARDRLRGRVSQLAAREDLESAPVLRAILAAGEPFDYAAAEARLGDSARGLLSAVVFADGMEEEESGSLTQAEACVSRLEAAALSARKAELKRLIREAEREGRFEEALALMRQLGVLE